MKTKRDRSAYHKEWRSKNPDYARQWKKKNPEKHKIIQKRFNNKRTEKEIIYRHSRIRPYIKKNNIESLNIKIMEYIKNGRPPSFISIILGIPILYVNKTIKEKYKM